MRTKKWLPAGGSIIFLCLLTVFFSISVYGMAGVPAGTVSPRQIEEESVPLDGTWKDYYLPENTYAYCPVNLDTNGFLELKVQTSFETSHLVYLLDSDMETIYYCTLYGEGAASPKTETFTYFLTSGQYYVRVQSYDKQCCGSFRIKGDFTPAATTETEPNNSFDEAMGLIPNDRSVRGFLSTRLNANFISDSLPEGTQDFYDYYIVTLDAAVWNVTVSVLENLNPANHGFHVVLYDSSRKILEEQYIGKTTTIERDFQTGTYYLLVEAANHGSGQYMISVANDGAPSAVPAGPEPTVFPFYPLVPDDPEEPSDEEPSGEEAMEGWTPIVDGNDWLEESEDYGWFTYDEVDELIEQELPNMDKLDTSRLPIRLLKSSDYHIYGLFCSTEENAFTWMEAIEFCENMCGHLASINSGEEQELASSLVQEYGVNAWLGGYTTNRSWKWLTGEPFEETWWSSGEPNGSGDSLQIYSNGQWDDTYNKNYTVTGFICEWE